MDNIGLVLILVRVVPLILGALICLSNWVCLYRSWRTKRFHSAVPLVGAIMLGVGLASFDRSAPYAWLSPFADYGTIAFICAIPRLSREAWNTSRFNIVRSFTGSSPNTEHALKLFKKGIFVIRAKVDPPQTANEHGALISEFGLVGKWRENDGAIELSEYAGDRTARLRAENGGFVAHEDNYPEDREYKYDSLEGIQFESRGKGNVD